MKPTLKRLKKDTEDYLKVKKTHEFKRTREKTSSILIGNKTYQVTEASNGQLMIYHYTGNVHIGKRTRFQRGMRTRESTKFSAIKRHVSFEQPLPTPNYSIQDIKFSSYLVPHTPIKKKRSKTQYAVMNNQSAHDHIEQNIKRSGFVDKKGHHEWLHLQAHSHGGAQHSRNLVAGSRDSNSLQIGVEDALIFCSNSLSKLSDKLFLNVDVSCPTIPGTHIGTICTYKIKIQDQEQQKTIFCNPIQVNMHFQASQSLKGLQYDHVRVVFKETCRNIMSKTAELLDIDIDNFFEEDIDLYAAQQLDDKSIQEELDDTSDEDDENDDNPTH